MKRSRISSIAHGRHPIAAPLSDSSVQTLLSRAVRRGDEHILDLGCGEGTWLIRALTEHPGLRATGVDIDPDGIAQARTAAAEAGVDDRLTLDVGDAKEYTAPHRFDLVLSVGAVHAFGGLDATLRAARQHLAADGSVLIGDGFWECPPDDATLRVGFTADEYDDLGTTVDRIRAQGWTPVYGHVSTIQEWDHYEWSWTGTLAEWALDHPTDPDSQAALDAADAHRTGWLHGYRGTLGFVTLLLRPSADPTS